MAEQHEERTSDEPEEKPAEPDQQPEAAVVEPVPATAVGSWGWGSMVGAAIGLGLGMIFALAGFWRGLLCLLFTALGALIGRLLWSDVGGSHD